MITFTDFYDDSIKVSFYGNVNSSRKLQGYTKNRTIGGKVKQRWIGKYESFSIEVLAMDAKNYKVLEEMFLDRSLIHINDDGNETYATIIGDTLSFSDFEDADGEIYFRGNLEMES